MVCGRRPAMGLMCDLPPLFPIAAVAHWVRSPRWSRGPRVEARDGAAREAAAIQAERSWTCNRTEETKVNNEQAAPETKGVTVMMWFPDSVPKRVLVLRRPASMEGVVRHEEEAFFG